MSICTNSSVSSEHAGVPPPPPHPKAYYTSASVCGLFHFSLSVFYTVEDLERNDGSAERPYLMPDNLLKVLKKKNKTEAQ